MPVNVPTTFHAFGQRSQRLLHEEDDEQVRKKVLLIFSISLLKICLIMNVLQVSFDPMDPNNIQASIKALAKSVHGDTIFGDLPRPRFSTQI